jgi:hypothetical protein
MSGLVSSPIVCLRLRINSVAPVLIVKDPATRPWFNGRPLRLATELDIGLLAGARHSALDLSAEHRHGECGAYDQGDGALALTMIETARGLFQNLNWRQRRLPKMLDFGDVLRRGSRGLIRRNDH